MGEEVTVTVLYRPVGTKELALIHACGDTAFPPRLPEQSICYPVLGEAYAMRIARDWNVPHSGAGYVARFAVRTGFLSHYEVQTVGSQHQEYWIPAEDLDELNRNIVGRIEIVAAFGAGRQDLAPEPASAPGVGPGQTEEPTP
jgi:hypothetical protein